MKVTFNWLRQYVDFDWSPEQLAERLTMLGIEVEGMQKLGGDFEGVVVAQVITRDKHPNADKLSLCRVNDGKGERQIVCGAQNFQPGDKVPLILPGASLPARSPGEAPLTIKVGKIRGVESQGMMCSPQELGLGGDVDGLLILRPDAPPGQSFAEYLGRAGSDVVYDLEITPNRPDWNSVIGIAREISAVTGNPLKIPSIASIANEANHGTKTKVEELVSVRLDDPELCPRYTARLIQGVRIGPSPDWLRSMLEKVGVRSINNVVDVTNYVMLETGQPLHAFDFRFLGKSTGNARASIIVRRANFGEKFKTLDGQERALLEPMLMIADETKPLALAGVMGGQNSEIQPDTQDVLLESASFKPQSIRATSKALGLRTESSYRFERGSDVGICDWASQRAAQLILETAGGRLAEGVVDAYPKPHQPRQITLRPEKANRLLGLNLELEEMVYFLGQLGLKIIGRKPRPVDSPPEVPEPVLVSVPSFRVDLKREADLIEEVARLFGVDKIPATPPSGAIGSNAYDTVHDELADARRLLSGLGVYEAQGQTLISDNAAKLAGYEQPVALANPLSSEMGVLRPSLLPGLLDSLRHNLSHRNEEVALFEIGRVFLPNPGGGAREERRIGLALTGRRAPLFWAGAERDATYDVFDLKGILEEFFDQFGVRGITYAKGNHPARLFLETGIIQLGKFEVGQFGQLPPPIAKRYDLRDPVLLAELNLDTILARRNTSKAFKPLPVFPAIRRDVAMLVPDTTTHEKVLQTVKQAKPANLDKIELFDVFRGKNVAAGQKSMAYACTYRHPERTLTDAEVNAAHEKLVEQLKRDLQALIR